MDEVGKKDGEVNVPQEEKVKFETSWPAVLLYLHLHLGAVYALFALLLEAKLATLLFALALGSVSLLGVTTGLHRLWTHRCYEAAWPLRLFLMICQTIVGQGSIYDCVLDHRLHHKFHGTENDPYNFNRGFFFAQIGCHLLREHPKRKELIKEIDMSDIEDDAIVMFQKSFYWILMPVFCFLLPINTPVEYWNETIFNSLFILGLLRYTIVLHLAWLVNSGEQLWSLKHGTTYPEDSNLVFFFNRSHNHQYHHLVPWDYRCGEYGTYDCGCSTAFIRVYAGFGWASKLRTITKDGVREALNTSVKTGKPITTSLQEHSVTVDWTNFH